jgi:uracil-DNA glycosylase
MLGNSSDSRYHQQVVTIRRTSVPLLPAALEHARDSIVGCELCPRLRDYCRGIGETRRRAYQDHVYWARPVPGFGDPRARILILGLAPGAHGANRTGRPFTGDGSGDFMYPVLHQLGLASKPRAISRDDGLKLRHAWIASVVRCAPPGDKPTPAEIRNCAAHLLAEIEALPRPTCSTPESSSANRPTPSPTAQSTASRPAYRFWPAIIPRCATQTPAASMPPCSRTSSCVRASSRGSIR